MQFLIFSKIVMTFAYLRNNDNRGIRKNNNNNKNNNDWNDNGKSLFNCSEMCAHSICLEQPQKFSLHTHSTSKSILQPSVATIHA